MVFLWKDGAYPSSLRWAEAVLQAFRSARTRLLCFDNEGTLANDKRWGRCLQAGCSGGKRCVIIIVSVQHRIQTYIYIYILCTYDILTVYNIDSHHIAISMMSKRIHFCPNFTIFICGCSSNHQHPSIRVAALWHLFFTDIQATGDWILYVYLHMTTLQFICI